MSSWLRKFESIVEYKLSKSPIREIDDIDIYMDEFEYREFCNQFKSNIISSTNTSFMDFQIDTVRYMGVKFLIHKVYNL
mgnify:FL=1